MNYLIFLRITIALLASLLPLLSFAQPVLEQRGAARQLMVGGKPFLIRGGEVFNSSTSNLGYMEPIWDRLVACHVNTVLVPVSWEQFEPVEGSYDYTLLDGMISAARAHQQRLVLLWFGSWKNMVSSYAPAWVRTQPDRFPMARNAAGQTLPMLSTFGEATLTADTRAFVALLTHVKRIDAQAQTVVMIQVQNEVGLSGGARDCSLAAEAAFRGPVPTELLAAFTAAGGALPAAVRGAWQAAGAKQSGNWEEVFGRTALTNELFMSWNYARYIGHIAATGKATYALPMFVNGALGRGGEIGTYPSGGPMPWFLEVWRAAAPAIDFLTPDIYVKEFGVWAQHFTRSANPLFVPEMRPVPAHALLALGRFKAIGVSPFGVEGRVTPEDEFSRVYGLIAQLESLILKHQASDSVSSAQVDQAEERAVLRFGSYAVQIQLRATRHNAPRPTEGYALVIAESEDTFVVAGKDVDVTFSLPNDPPAIVGFDRVEEGYYREEKWTPTRRFNGDEIMISYDFDALAAVRQTGTGLRFDQPSPILQRVKVLKTR